MDEIRHVTVFDIPDINRNHCWLMVGALRSELGS